MRSRKGELSRPLGSTDQNLVAYRRLRHNRRWMSEHVGQYVVFVDGHCVGSDRDRMALITDVRSRYPNRPRFITRVTRADYDQVLDIPSDLTYVRI
jgi:hypothetical protein